MACGPGCTDCPARRGEVPSDAPALLDLAWGMMQMEAGPHDFWSVHTALDAFHRGLGARRPDPADELLRQHVMMHLQPAPSGAGPWPTVILDDHGAAAPPQMGPQNWLADERAPAPQQQPVAGSQDRLAGPVPGQRPSHVEALKQVEAGAVKIASGSVGDPEYQFLNLPTEWLIDERPLCCVDPLEFPVPSPKYFVKRGSIGTHFGYSAKYSDIWPCRCRCCYFAKYVMYTVRRTTVFGTRSEGTTEPVEDCVVLTWHHVAGNIWIPSLKGNTGSGTRADGPYDVALCDPPKVDPKRDMVRDGLACSWLRTDRPQFGRYAWDAMSAYWYFMGVVYDSCNNWAIRAINAFEMRVYADSLLSVAASSDGKWRPTGRGAVEWLPMERIR